MHITYLVIGWVIVAVVLPGVVLSFRTAAPSAHLLWAFRFFGIASILHAVSLILILGTIGQPGSGLLEAFTNVMLAGLFAYYAIDTRRRRDQAARKEQAAYQEFLRQN